MRILVAPDRFAGETSPALSAGEAAAAVAAGWVAVAPGDETDLLPLSDGGPGFLDVLRPALGGDLRVVTVAGPLGEPTPARVLLTQDTAYVEAAEAAGRHLVPRPGPGTALTATTAGVADLIAAALATGRPRIVIGTGGTATTDGGRGLLAALGGLDAARERLAGTEVVVATATDAPLMGHSGAAHGFAAAKGADRPTRDTLEERLRAWATETDGGLAVRPGAGAGGGLGFGLLLLGATRVNGTELVAAAVGLAERVAAADLAVTGLAVFDWEALRGRVPVAVARAAQAAGRPTLVLAERVDVGRRELSAAGIDAAYAVADLPGAGSPPATAAGRLTLLAGRVARTWGRR